MGRKTQLKRIHKADLFSPIAEEALLTLQLSRNYQYVVVESKMENLLSTFCKTFHLKEQTLN